MTLILLLVPLWLFDQTLDSWFCSRLTRSSGVACLGAFVITYPNPLTKFSVSQSTFNGSNFHTHTHTHTSTHCVFVDYSFPTKFKLKTNEYTQLPRQLRNFWNCLGNWGKSRHFWKCLGNWGNLNSISSRKQYNMKNVF